MSRRPGQRAGYEVPHLRRLREEKRLLQSELAAECGVSTWTIGALERGDRRASLVLIRQLEKALGATAAQLGADLPPRRT